ncbi:MAG: STAS domain-containing protein, partial [Acidimicrobiales bacterium]
MSGQPDGAAVHGEADIATVNLFAEAVESLARRSHGAASSAEACLDLADLEFIDVSGARVLVEAAASMGPGRQLVIRHPPEMLVRILEVGWGRVPGLRLEAEPNASTVERPQRLRS